MKSIIFLLLFICCPKVHCVSAQIPKHILECYRQNLTDLYDNLKLPMTMPLLIELLQKLELNKSLDMRLFSTSLMYRVKFDGIQAYPSAEEEENSVPVGPTATHFRKFKLLLNYLLSGNDQLFPEDVLTKLEFCVLHRMISSSVQAWERGDEAVTCPQIKMLPTDGHPRRLIYKMQKSSCPIERGVMKTQWGDISVGNILLAIAAALQNQDVKLMQILDILKVDEHIEFLPNDTRNTRTNVNEEINNLWAVTLAGDLAEVIAYQRVFVQQLIFGEATAGAWNDSLVPRVYYLPDAIDNHWEMTLAESLGGIDGAIIGSKVKAWTEQMGRLRFSQILDMYYSRQGLHFSANFRACQRKENIRSILKDVDLVKQTTAMAKLLQHYYQSNPDAEEWVPIPEDKIQRYSEQLVNDFQQRLDALTDAYSACEKGYDVPPSDIFIVIDGTYSGYDGKRLIGSLAQATDVSRFGSRMSIISGNGFWMTNFTNSIFQIFEDLSNNDHLWPTSLSLPDSLSTIISFLNNKTNKECMNKYRSTRTSVIVVLSLTSTISSTDFDKTQSLVKTIKALNPSTALYYFTSELTKTSYQLLTNNEYFNDKIITTDTRIEAIVDAIAEELGRISGQIVELHCDSDKLHYEDYLMTKVNTFYEIPYHILQDLTNGVTVEFSGHEYGNISICAGNKAVQEHKVCRWISERNTNVQFHTKNLCEDNQPCTVLFKVNLLNTNNKCLDDECRYPDQGRLQISTTWSSSSPLMINFIMMLLITTSIFIF